MVLDKELLIAEAKAYFNMKRLFSEYDPMLGIYLEDLGRNVLANDALGKLQTERKIKLHLKDKLREEQ
jgi:hypothetical protein